MTAITQGATTTNAAGIKWADLLNLRASVDPAYWPGSRWLMNLTTLSAIEAFADTTNVRPLFVPAHDADDPNESPAGRIMGFNVEIVPEMDSPGVNKWPLAFGNVARGYTVRQAGAPQLLVLNERYVDSLERGAFVWARYDGQLTDSRALRSLELT